MPREQRFEVDEESDTRIDGQEVTRVTDLRWIGVGGKIRTSAEHSRRPVTDAAPAKERVRTDVAIIEETSRPRPPKPSLSAVEARSEPAAPPVPAAGMMRVGAEDEFILAWGRSNEAVRSKGRQLLLSGCLNVALAGVVGYLAWQGTRKETLVFVRDSLGNIVQADANSFLHAGDVRSESEIKAFMRDWVIDAFSWTPLDVEDRVAASLGLVDGKAHGLAKAGMRLAERKSHVDQGVSGGVYRDGERQAQTVIMRRKPLEVMVSVERFLVDKGGTTQDGGPLFVRAILREVPRSSTNGHGLMIVDVQISEKL